VTSQASNQCLWFHSAVSSTDHSIEQEKAKGSN
jgi:hypothetical protein